MIACDVVRCFSCNVVAQDWERSDSVIDEHFKHSPYCSFLQSFAPSKEVNNAKKPSNDHLSATTFEQHGSPASDSHDCSTVFMSNYVTSDGVKDHCSEQFVVSIIVLFTVKSSCL